jgi:hypothetical protein
MEQYLLGIVDLTATEGRTSRDVSNVPTGEVTALLKSRHRRLTRRVDGEVALT